MRRALLFAALLALLSARPWTIAGGHHRYEPDESEEPEESAQAEADEQAAKSEQDAQQEGDAPSPRQELIFRKARELSEHGRRQEQSGRIPPSSSSMRAGDSRRDRR